MAKDPALSNKLPFSHVLAFALLACVPIACSTPPSQQIGGSGGAGTGGEMNGGGGSGGSSTGGNGGSGGGSPGACVDATRVDLLFAIDNSRSMADKFYVQAVGISDFLQNLVNPVCRDANGQAPLPQPAYPTDPCPAGTQREFAPMLDIHIGVVSSSIGGHGSDSCPDIDTNSAECSPAPNMTNNDKGHLIARLDQCGGQEAPTYQNKKFLAWDPTNKYGGETVIDDGADHGLVPSLRDMVIGAGQTGCQYQSQLESVYRFLADPDPYESIAVTNYKAEPMGTDTVVLAQRAEFLRPDSLLLVVMLTGDEDCSIKEFGQYYYVAQQESNGVPVRLPRARQECAIDPNDPCCKSCGQSKGTCPTDPTCADPNGGTGPALLSAAEDDPKLRCWDQKRRFGIDFLYPTDRYVQAFSSAMIADRSGNVVPNPIFSDLNPNDGNTNIRGPQQVLFAGIVGVPWQDLARDPKNLKKGNKNAAELNMPVNANGFNTWDVILGDATTNKKPLDPLMIETYQKRTGANPITGDALVDASMPLANPINGHERTIANDDLQYACIAPLLPGTDRDCTNTNLSACDCTDTTNDNPVCQQDPNNMGKPTLQTKYKAYPGLRPLSVVRGMGDQSVVGSICAAQFFDKGYESTDFAYRPTMEAIAAWIKRRSCTATP